MSKLKASIIVNNYNYAAYLGEAIDSALAQTYANVEVIVVDDGSTDASREIIASYGDGIVTIMKDNGGQVSAFNAGFEVATGDVVLFLDSDDRLDKDCLERALTFWEAGDSMLLFQLRVIDVAGQLAGMHHPTDAAMPTGSARDQVLSRGNYPAPPTSGLLFSRQALRKVFPLTIHSRECAVDSFLRILIPFLGESRFIHEAMGDYRIHHQNMSAQYTRVAKIRRTLSSNMVKQARLEALAGREGFSVPAGLFRGGMKDIKGRLVSLRVDKEGHPIHGDSRLGLCRKGVILSLGSSKDGWVKRVAAAGWFVLVSVLPLFLIRPIIELAYREATLKLQG